MTQRGHVIALRPAGAPLRIHPPSQDHESARPGALIQVADRVTRRESADSRRELETHEITVGEDDRHTVQP